MNMHFLSIIRRFEMAYTRTEMEKYGLTPLEGRLILMLKNNRCCQDELGFRLNIDKAGIARAIALLEDKGLVSREVNIHNRRQKFVHLTEKGVEMYGHICDIYTSWDNICYTGFSDGERALHQDFLKRMSENAMAYQKTNGGN